MTDRPADFLAPLASGDARERAAALASLAGHGDDATLVAMARLLADPDAAVRVSAARGLAAAERPWSANPVPAEVIYGLTAGLGDPAPSQRSASAEALAVLGDARAGAAVAAAASSEEDPSVRSAMIAALGELGGQEALAALEAFASGGDAASRAAAVDALGGRPALEAFHPLTRALGDSEAAVRHQAALALGRLDTDEADAVLQEATAGPRPDGWDVAWHPAMDPALALADVELRVETTAGPTGVVIELRRRASDAPLAGASVGLAPEPPPDEGDVVAIADWLDARGRMAVPGLPPGRYRLRLLAPVIGRRRLQSPAGAATGLPVDFSEAAAASTAETPAGRPRIVRRADGEVSAHIVADAGVVHLRVRAEHDPHGAVAVIAFRADVFTPPLVVVPLVDRLGAWEGEIRLGPVRSLAVEGPVELLAPEELDADWAVAAVAVSLPLSASYRDERAWDALAERPNLPEAVRAVILENRARDRGDA